MILRRRRQVQQGADIRVRLARTGIKQGVRFHLLSFPQVTPGNLSVRVTGVRRVPTTDGAELLVSLHLAREGEESKISVPVQFEIDGEKVPVRREKLEGLVYYHPNKREVAAPICRLLEAGGSTWLLRDVRLAEGARHHGVWFVTRQNREGEHVANGA